MPPLTRLTEADVERKVQVQCCFTSTETVRTVRDGQDGHLNFHTAPDLCNFTVA